MTTLILVVGSHKKMYVFDMPGIHDMQAHTQYTAHTCVNA